MNNRKQNHYRLDLAILILLTLMFRVIYAAAQTGPGKGEILFNEKNYYGAERFFTEALKEDVHNAEAHYFLGRIAFEQEAFEKASGHFEKATELDPENSMYFTWKGINYLRILSSVDFMKQAVYAPKALSSLEKAVELDENNVEARIYLAGYYGNAPSFAGGSAEKAEEQFDAIFSINPGHKGALLQYGILKMQSGDHPEAVNSFEKLIAIDPEFFPAYFHMGRLSAESGAYPEQGSLSLIRFIDLAPDSFDDSRDEAWWYLGRIYDSQGESRKAIKAFEKAISLDPENEDYRKSLKNIL